MPQEPGLLEEERPRLVFFHSKRDGRSRRVEGFIAQVLQRRSNHDTFVLHEVEVSERPDIAERFGINEVPTLLLIADRRVQKRLAQPKSCRQTEELLQPWLRAGRPRSEAGAAALRRTASSRA